ncbi:hypothetical protein CROQUDRAFT_649955 [Cronartium quercuum f. sp. fusiforme G11]|uniref:thioredoxin-dependent peroxiredoxin n=1 Tax=Cronartium quercuum f. sp. fusiforme G11 TaxID=708437 RepID=A0A9P6NYL1_9BASI|nr:hypothetical protein CROQUDRAFT_649955 [Cronartium quercuum f. sp. fusiforme G11]
MAPKRTATADQEGENAVQPRRSSRVTSKPTSFGSSKAPNSKQNGTTKSKAGSKKTAKGPTESELKKASSDASLSALSSLGDAEKEPAPEDAANDKNTEKKEDVPSAPKKSKTDDETPEDNAESTNSDSRKKLVVGDKLPEGISLSNQDEETIDILESVKEKGAIIFIYPKANTPGCTNQACGFRDLHQEIVDAGYQVFGLSMDSPKTQNNWKEKQSLPYNLLCDPKQELIKLLGGSKSATQVQRSHYIIAAGGTILNITSPASPTNGPKEALDFIKQL